MISLKSVSKPVQGEAAAAFSPPSNERAEHSGKKGPAAEASRVARQRLVTGTLRRTESILGPDERVRIYDTDLDPWRMILSLEITGANGVGFIGTGWLVGPKTVITAGHCVLDSQMGGWASRISLFTGRGTPVEKRVEATRFSANDRWVNTQATAPDMDFDIGCIHLDTALGDETGFFGVLALPAAELPGNMVNVAGFPADRGGGEELYHHRNRILRVTDRRLFYDVDTYGGQSGAPAWIYEGTSNIPKVIGIHAYGVGGTPSSFGLQANSAPRIIPEVVTLIQAWVAAEAGRGG